jgi:putative addiction module CopG family antidote
MTIRLPEDLERFIHAKVQSGQFASEEAAIVEAVRILQQRDREHASEEERIEALLINGLESGPSTPMTSRDWDEIEREGQRLIAARKARKAR